MQPADGGPARILEIVADNPGRAGAQVGLNYNQMTVLAVRYRLDDAAHTPLAGQEVRFAIFDDPRGSTLSADRARTDDTGMASVSLTAGSEETLFRVRASADGASVDYRVATSRLGFVDFDVKLAWSTTAPLMTLRALLYIDKTCAALPEAPTVAPALSELSGPGPNATLGFRFLLSRSYAILARAEDTAGHLLAEGCVDLGPAQLPVGVTTVLSVPLTAVSTRLDGRYQIVTTLAWSTDERTQRTAPYSRWSRCPFGPAEALVDAILTAPSLPAPLATAITAHRGALLSSGCRAGTAGAVASVDAQLESALALPGTVGAQLSTVADEVDQLFTTARLSSELTVVGVGAAQSGRHRLTTLGLSIGPTKQLTPDVDLGQLGLPVIEAWPVSLGLDSNSLSIGAHGFTLGLPARLLAAFGELSLAVHLPSVTNPAPHDLAIQTVKETASGGKTDCAAVEVVICGVIGASGCVGPIATACGSATTTWGNALDATFADGPGGLDLVWSGAATSIDTDGDLIVDTLKPATWVTSFGAPSPFSALREP